MVTRVAIFAPLTLAQLEGEDDVFVVPTKFAHKALCLAQHTASYMEGTKFQQLFESGGQGTVAYSSEVVEGEEVKVLSQVTRHQVELLEHLFCKTAGLEEIFHVK